MTTPVVRAFAATGDVRQSVVRTRTDSPAASSGKGIDDLRPDVELSIGDATPAIQTARIMIALEPIIRRMEPDWLFTAGAVNSTLAAALVGSKLGIRVAHIEAGTRCGDPAQPEEVNRALTDRVSASLFTTEAMSRDNLVREGISDHRIHFVGSVAIDMLDRVLDTARNLGVPDMLGLEQRKFVLAFLTDPGIADGSGRDGLVERVEALDEAAVCCDCQVVVALTPAVARRVRDLGLDAQIRTIEIIEDPGYVERIAMLDSAAAMVMDRAGLQEEATVLGVPCITLGSLTASPVTVSEGTNRLLGEDLFSLTDALRDALLTERTPSRPELWDGHAGQRIAEATLSVNGGSR